MNTLVLVLLMCIVLIPVYGYINTIYKSLAINVVQKKNEGKTILYVMAHPDDESMFFVPSIKHFKAEKGNKIYLLCMCNGNAAGLGKIREKELEKACKYLQFDEAPYIAEDQDLPDSMDIEWPKGVVAEQITRYLQMQAQNDIHFDIIVTFDKKGVSGHTNHIQTFYGCMQVMREQKFQRLKAVYSLQTVNMLRKYIGTMDSNYINMMDYQAVSLDPRDVATALSLHNSQFVWFRKLFILFSRYTWWNSFDVYKLSDTNKPLKSGETEVHDAN